MKISVLAGLLISLFHLSACNNCDSYETSNTSIKILMDNTLLIDSIVFRGASEVIRPHSNSAEITLNPYENICYCDIYTNGTQRFLGLMYKREMIYDCGSYFIEYRIDSLIHNFNHAMYQPMYEGPSLITLK